MTEELKTLRQIGVRIRDKDKLRAEAIKWWKAIDRDCYTPFGSPMIRELGGDPRTWIEKFFNLTDEDLK